jgi:hypothetical protein
MIALFLLLRAVNSYGDPVPWSHQASPVLTALSVLRTTKYPPSLDFVLMTIGPALLALAYFDKRRLDAHHPLVTFLFAPLPSMGGPRDRLPPDLGYPLWVTYVVWVALVVSLYPLCRRVADFKARTKGSWASYL